MTTEANPPSEYVIYRSQGRCLVVGEGKAIEELLAMAGSTSALSFHALVTDVASPVLFDACAAIGCPLTSGRPVELQGYLGAFRLRLESGDQWGPFDLVIDLSQPPLITAEVLPFGYFIPGEDRRRTLEELERWIGEFEKPRYFSYRPDLCAHGGPRHQGCRACIEVCPAQAIVSVAERRIEVNPYLCQGCGDCTAVCPSGALDYRTVERQILLEGLFAELFQSPGATILFYPEAEPNDFHREGWIRRSLPTVAACGSEVWLALIAAGAAGVRLQRRGLLSGSRETLQGQMAWVNALLDGLGYGNDRVAWLEDDPQPVAGKAIAPGRLAALPGKRDMLELALHHLIRQAERPPEWIPLPRGAPLGSVEVDEERCTLCFACVGACPVQALQTGNDGFRLRLVEQNCLQCGWCADVCPETAVRLVPRLLTDGQRRRQPRLLHQEAVFHCPECGKGFATRKIIETVLARIAGHPLFADARQKRRLLLCEDCRVRDLMRDHER